MPDDHTMSEQGLVKITTEAIASIAQIAATQVDGVAEMASDLSEKVEKLFGRKSAGSGVKVVLSEKEVDLTINLILEYGADISEVAVEVQKRAGKAVEEMSKLVVREVNVNVKGVKHVGGRKPARHDDAEG